MPERNSQTLLNSVTQTTAQKELLRLRQIEKYAKILHKDISDGFLADQDTFELLGEVLYPPIDPDQLKLV